MLAATPCEQYTMKRAALFSALTGLRHCDIQKMRWKEIQIDGDQARLNARRRTTKDVEYMPFRRRHWNFAANRVSPTNLFLKTSPLPRGFPVHSKRGLTKQVLQRKLRFTASDILLQPCN